MAVPDAKRKEPYNGTLLYPVHSPCRVGVCSSADCKWSLQAHPTSNAGALQNGYGGSGGSIPMVRKTNMLFFF